MVDETEFERAIRAAAQQRILYLPHAVRQMARPERMISVADVESAVFAGALIEDYPEDARGHSGLLLGFGAGDRPIHVVCSPKDEYLAVITAYVPQPDEWSADFRLRRAR